MLNAALSYVAEQFSVTPLCWPSQGQCGCGRKHTGRQIGKAPVTNNGLKDATSTQQGVHEYWIHWPKANIGIAIPRGYFVLDVDIEHNGFDSLSKMQIDLDFDLPGTWLVTTGSGGQHYWYKTDKPIRNTARLGGYDGLDIRGIGGYVVAPPSRHLSGYRYETSPVWTGPIVDAPPKLIELCLKSSTIVNSNLSSSNTIYLEGQRNDRLTRDAGAMRRRGLSEQAIYAALQVVNQEQCQPPLSDREVLTISQSIGRYPPEPAHQAKFKGTI